MVEKIITVEQLINANTDANDLGRIMNEVAWVVIDTRLGKKCYSIATINALIETADTDLKSLLVDTEALSVRLDSLLEEANVALDQLNAVTDEDGFIKAQKVKTLAGETLEQLSTGARSVETGGTGAESASGARANLDVYSKSQVESLIVTGGQGSVIGISGGGTGADSAEEARVNLDVYSTTEVDTELNKKATDQSVIDLSNAALKKESNLEDISNKQQARNNLDVYSQTEVDTAIANATPTIPKATETALGVAKIATTSIAQAGVNDTDIITAKKLADTRKSVWSNKTSMLFGTTYVNSSLFDRDLSVISQEVVQGYVTIRCVFIDLITLVETTVFFGAHANYSNPTIASAVFTIPAQTSYKISVVDTISNATKIATVLKWSERDYA